MNKALSCTACLLLWMCSTLCAARADGFTYGAWLPYWESASALGEADLLTGRLDEAIAFACVFDQDDHPLMPPETEAMLEALQACESDHAVFLSVVNDVDLGEGKYEQKSVKLLKRLLSSEKSVDSHLEALTTLVDRYSLTGLELDYENLRDDRSLWEAYVELIRRLWTVCERDGVRLRIVLPWNAPRFTELPQGPEYSVMCYNLYGYHSDAGPKADLDFLAETCALYQPMGSGVRMAFATGGFDWHGDTITALTQEEAQAQLDEAGAEPIRDEKSGALTAVYVSEEETHEVWFADAATLAIWRDTCAAASFVSFDLFRLGGNDLFDWEHALFDRQP